MSRPATDRACCYCCFVLAGKNGRSIVLTTHSMEEAEALCDRLGIFVDGRLVCIGNPRELTSRFAGYLVSAWGQGGSGGGLGECRRGGRDLASVGGQSREGRGVYCMCVRAPGE